jgi:hypothetical protein
MKRVMNKTIDANDAQAICYNEAAGAFKQSPVGPKLISLGTFAVAKRIGAGKQLAIWTAGATDTVTMGAAGVASLALGLGGIPLEQSKWNYLSMGEDSWLIASAATVYVFEIADDTEIR